MDWLDELSPQQAQALHNDKKAVIIDVREIGEFAAKRIPCALLHPLSEFDPAALPCDPARPVVFHCAGGVRSAKAAEAYRAHVGCDRVSHIAGGIAAWAECGLPLTEAD